MYCLLFKKMPSVRESRYKFSDLRSKDAYQYKVPSSIPELIHSELGSAVVWLLNNIVYVDYQI